MKNLNDNNIIYYWYEYHLLLNETSFTSKNNCTKKRQRKDKTHGFATQLHAKLAHKKGV